MTITQLLLKIMKPCTTQMKYFNYKQHLVHLKTTKQINKLHEQLYLINI